MTSALLNNRYRILQELGTGGFGQTFLAEDTQMPSKRRCVIKQLKPVTGNPQIYQLVQERFAREAAVLEQLGEGNSQIPKLFAYFELEGQFYLVQEWIEGETFGKWVQKSGRLQESEVRSLLSQVLPVLDYVHRFRIVHRDIKPDNIILRQKDGKPVLIDFGAVKETMGTVVSSSGGSTNSIAIGTPGFMPPEQAAGRPLYSSDLYSLGMTAIYLLTGKLPQELPTDPATGEVLWRQFAPSASPGLAMVLDRTIRFNPRDRFATALEMLNALKSDVNSQVSTVAIAPASPAALPAVAVPPSPRKYNSRTFASITVGVLALSFFVGFALAKQYLISQNAIDDPPPENPPISPIPAEVPSDPTPPVISQPTPPTPPEIQEFYFLADSAFKNRDNAARQIERLKSLGYDAGSFWIPDYSTLSYSPYEQVYAEKFSDRNSCIARLKEYVLENSEAYCALASTDPNASPDAIEGKDVIPQPAVTQSDRPNPADFIQEYYSNINDQLYGTAWGQLSPQFQKTGSKDYAEYRGWWQSVRQVVVRDVTVTQERQDYAIVETRLTYYMTDGRVSSDNLEMTLIWDPSEENWVINRTRALGN